MLAELGLAGSELSVLLTDDTTIHALNRTHRGKDRPTDVLAFPLDGETSEAPELLGDVVISLDTAARQAAARRRPLAEEVRFLLAHGVLHLVGYDHGTPSEKRAMVAMTRRLVRSAAHVPLPESPALHRKPTPAHRRRVARGISGKARKIAG